MKRSLMLIFFLAATFGFAEAQNIFSTTIHTSTATGDPVAVDEVNMFKIDETAKTFTHVQGANEFMYVILSRTLNSSFWRYELANAEGVLVSVTVDQNFKSFTFHSSADPEYISNIYSN